MRKGGEEEKEIERFKAEVKRVNPALPVPAQDYEQLDALDAIMIYAPVYAKWQASSEDIPPSSISTSKEPCYTMHKHAGLYGLRWVRKDDYWHLQKGVLVEEIE